MGRSQSYAPSRHDSIESTMKSDVLSCTKDTAGPSRVIRAPSYTSDLPPSYDAVVASSSYVAPTPVARSEEVYVTPPAQYPINQPVVTFPNTHTCLRQDPLRNIPLIGLVRIALAPVAVPYNCYSRANQCGQCGAGIGRQLTGLAIAAASRKIQEKQLKKQAKRAARRC